MMNFKSLFKYLIIALAISFLISLIPVAVYVWKFRTFELSTDFSEWVDFADFLSGTSGTLLSFCAVVFTLVSIYISIKIAGFIQDQEFKFSKAQSDSNLELTFTQIKPYPYLHLEKLPETTTIILQNMGLGPLVVVKFVIRFRGIEDFDSIRKLFDAKHIKNSTVGSRIEINSAPDHVLAPNSDKLILQIISTNENEDNFLKMQSSFREILMDCSIILMCEDIFGNTFTYSKDLSFFKE